MRTAPVARHPPTQPKSQRRPLARRGLGMVMAMLLGVPGASGADESDPEAELTAVRNRIETLDARLNEARMAKDRLAAQLREVERRIGRVAGRLRELEAALADKAAQLEELRAAERRHRHALGEHRAALRRQIRASYIMGRQDYLKLLFNQENPAALARVLTYHGYVSRARARRMERTKHELERIAEIERDVEAQTRELAALRREKERQRAELEGYSEARARVLSELEAEIGDTDQRLRRLRRDEAKLAELVRELRDALADIPNTLDERSPFENLRGRLPWPSGGALRARFGTPRGSGDLEWQGVWIAAESGQEVRAISHGRVAYADWLRGFGLLTIIDHGGGYMSLYGHSQSLYKEPGDWVDKGEVIASIGASGGHSQSGLYFEIRHDGRPVDPLRWCSTSAGGPALVTR
ncbi:MAG: peptidoglycan DD-metalloendopeptidase family protein [Gammaproteobacteria bacterium]|nr:peptidoglycan DD-metalloendopeptidase family protein [Gammaproteobacteria bacterium]NIR81828.1 peptidoglycan DD-metalloendopeptidase family protein [Gammaproteobacteria bacterium]NIR88660.1 peptidoglycan DD-metalloendopeptidase family protein [Gammaproteobacteria bacterium]NIU02936.1 peptidoglycan DD-metalloendopeptidase family protein [Gammaproteobacteria bacterium]NIV50457.1 peptidoglycan DD-metalloendopeptidase family protein [Gammaproteobacteria bacterium]